MTDSTTGTAGGGSPVTNNDAWLSQAFQIGDCRVITVRSGFGGGKTAMFGFLAQTKRLLTSARATIPDAAEIHYDIHPYVPDTDVEHCLLTGDGNTTVTYQGKPATPAVRVLSDLATLDFISNSSSGLVWRYQRPDYPAYGAALTNAVGSDADTTAQSRSDAVPDLPVGALVAPSEVSVPPLVRPMFVEAAVGIRVRYNFKELDGLRADLLRHGGGINAAICFVIIMVLAALGHCLPVISFVLIMVATSRRYGRRSEPNDHHASCPPVFSRHRRGALVAPS